MATRTVVCPECDSPLSPGRFACSFCGALVAAVATVARSFNPADQASPPVLMSAPPDEPPMPVAAPATPAAHAVQAAPAALVDEPPPPRKARIAAPTRRTKPPARASNPGAKIGVATEEPRPLPPEGVTWPPMRSDVTASAPAEAPRSSPSPAPSWPEHPAWPPQRTVEAVAPPVGQSPARVPAGAYLPPSAVLPPGESLPIPGSAKATGSGDHARRSGPDVSTSLNLRLGEGTGPLGMPADAPTRVVVLGAGVAALGFVLPWADIVIGSGSIGGYLEQWGLAGPGHALILALVVGLAILAIVAEHLPRWVRLGLPSIAVACLLSGLVWPYLVGPFDASIGVYVVAVGALVMIAGGLLDRVATRHVESPATV